MANKLILSILISLLCSSLAVTDDAIPVLIGTKNQDINTTGECGVYRIATNYKHLTISITELKNTDKLIITDKPLDSCDATDCSPQSNICQSNIELA